MADELPELNLFKFSSPPAPAELIRCFREFPELASPVTHYEAPQPGFYGLTAFKDGESMLLSAFTDPRLLNPPFYAKAALPFLNLLFHAPAADAFVFNPPLPQARFPAASIRLDKKRLSAVIGFLQTPAAFPENTDFEAAAKSEAELGSLHRANYFSEIHLSRNPGRPPMGFYAGILTGLGLYQEAYEYVKDAADPEFYCHLAEIHRRTGDPDAARQMLEKVPPGSPFADKKDLELAWLAFEAGDIPAARDTFKRLADKSVLKTEGLFGQGAALSADALKNKNRREMDEALNIFNTALQNPSPLAAQIFFHLGGICFRAGNHNDAAACYRSSVNLWPAVQSRANLCLAFIKTGNIREAAALVNEIALTDLATSSRLAAELPQAQGHAMLKVSREIETSARELRPARPAAVETRTAFIPRQAEPAPAAQAPEQPKPPLITPRQPEPPQAAPEQPKTAVIKPLQPEPPQAAPEQPKTAVIKPQRPGNAPAAPGPQAGQQPPNAMASLEAATPKISNRSMRPFDPAQGKPFDPAQGKPFDPAQGKPPGMNKPPAAKPPAIKLPDIKPVIPDNPAEDKPSPDRPARKPFTETFKGAFDSAPSMTDEETRKDEFMGRAFKLASSLEDAFNRKVYFNTDGLTEVEKKLRLTFIHARPDPQTCLEVVKDSAAFLCYVLQERLKFRLIKFMDFDPWGWPMMVAAPKRIVTYPVVRLWQLLWDETVPEPGWLSKYFLYVQSELENQEPRPLGMEAVARKRGSHRERLIDAQTEHKRIMILVSTLTETNGIELGRAGLAKLESVIKANFRPDIPPTTDGWKLLRCYGHILAEILSKDLKAAWFSADGNDGLWSMQLPWKTFVFPLGKVYKTASQRDSLVTYYDALLEDKLRYSGR